MTVLPMSRLAVSRSRVVVPRLDWPLFGAAGMILMIGTLLVWSATSSNDLLTQGQPTAYLHKHLVNILIGLVLAPDRVTYRVRPGMYMGQNDGRITAVYEDRIEMVELVPDGAGGWLERQAKIALDDND